MPVLSFETIFKRTVLILLGEQVNSYLLTFDDKPVQYHTDGLAELLAKTMSCAETELQQACCSSTLLLNLLWIIKKNLRSRAIFL